MGQQAVQRGAEDALHGGGADVAARQAQQRQPGRGGADQPAVFAERHQAFGDGAQAFGLRMQAHDDAGGVAGGEELVLHHARAAAHQGQGVAVVAAAVAGDVQHAQQLAAGVGDGGGGTGEEAVALQVVLAGMHHARRAVGKVGFAGGVQQQALRVGQQHEAVAALHLLVQEGHHRPGVRHEGVAVLQRTGELGAAGVGGALRAAQGLQAVGRRGRLGCGHGGCLLCGPSGSSAGLIVPRVADGRLTGPTVKGLCRAPAACAETARPAARGRSIS